MEEKSYSEEDLQLAFRMGNKLLTERNAAIIITAFVCGIIIGFMLGLTMGA